MDGKIYKMKMVKFPRQRRRKWKIWKYLILLIVPILELVKFVIKTLGYYYASIKNQYKSSSFSVA